MVQYSGRAELNRTKLANNGQIIGLRQQTRGKEAEGQVAVAGAMQLHIASPAPQTLQLLQRRTTSLRLDRGQGQTQHAE
jgi:hypothetical protein